MGKVDRFLTWVHVIFFWALGSAVFVGGDQFHPGQ